MSTPDPQPAPDAQEPEQPPVAEAERPDVEVVLPPEAGTGPLPAKREPDPAYSRLEQAADAALTLPGIPGRDEFLSLAMQARILAMSAGAPKAVRGNPHLAFHLAMIGRDLGISPTAAIQMVDVIGYDDRAATYDKQYDRVQLSVSPELLNSQIKRLGLGSIVKAASTPTSCTAVALLPGGRLDYRCARLWPEHVEPDANGGPCTCTLDKVLGEVTFAWYDAIVAGLVDGACTGPDAHTSMCLSGGQGSSGKRCHQGYRAYPQRMMWWRAAGWAQSDYFPEAGVGLYSPEELGAVVDESGRPIDPADVELPSGFEPAPPAPPGPAEDLLAEAEDGTELAGIRQELRGRVDAVLAAGEGAKSALATMWEEEDGEGYRKTPPFPHLRRRHVTRTKAIVASIEARIKRGEWGDDAKDAWAAAATPAAPAGRHAAESCQEWSQCAKPAGHEPPCESFGGDNPPTDEAAPQSPQEGGDAESGDEPTEPGEAQDADEGVRCEACGVKEGAEHLAELHELADVADRARATQAAAAPAAEPEEDPEARRMRIEAEVLAEVKGMTLTDVATELERRKIEPAGGPPAQRSQLRQALVEERTTPEAAEE